MKSQHVDNYMRSVMEDEPKKEKQWQAWTRDENENKKEDKCKKRKDEEETEEISLRGRVTNFAEAFSAHGFSKIILSRNWLRRVTWLIVCLVMAVWGSYQCYSIITEYFMYPKQVNMEIKEETKALFPAITVCNLNPLPAREDLTYHETWSSFVDMEEQNSEPECDGLTRYGSDYDDYYDYNDYPQPYSGDFYDGSSSSTSWGGSSSPIYPPGGTTKSATTGTSTTTDRATTGTSTTTRTSITTDSATTESTTTDSTILTTGITTANGITSDSITTGSTTADSITTGSTTADSITTEGTTTDSITTEGTTTDSITTDSITTEEEPTTTKDPYYENNDYGKDYYGSNYNGYYDYDNNKSGMRKKRSPREEEAKRAETNTNQEPARLYRKDWTEKITEKQLKEIYERKRVINEERRRTGKLHMMMKDVYAQIQQKMKESMEEKKKKPRNKRNVMWFNFFGADEEEGEEAEEEDEEEEEEVDVQEIVSSGERTIPFPTSPRSKVVDYLTFTEMYQHFFESSDSPRVKRKADGDDSGKNTRDGEREEQMSKEMIRKIRDQCSPYYNYFRSRERERSNVDEDDTIYLDEEEIASRCTKDDYKETVSLSPICNLEIVCDNFGCYDFFLNDYKDGNNGTHRCPSCGDGLCWMEEWVESYMDGKLLTEQVASIYAQSRTSDFSDLLGVYSPSKDDVGKHYLDAKDFIKACSYDRRPCSHKHFHTWTSDQFGKCYTFNSAYHQVTQNNKTYNGRVRSTTSTGPMNGLRLTININLEQYVSLLSPDIGVRVVVHSPYELPFPEEQGFNVSPSAGASVSISRKVIERVGHPHGRCRKKSGSSKYKEYTSLGCKKMCLEKEYWRKCECYVGKSPVYHRDKQDLNQPKRQCTAFDVKQRLCVEMVQYNYLKGKLTCDCPSSCKETIYMPQVTVSEQNMMFYTILQNLKKTEVDGSLCDNSGNSDPVRLHFYMDSLSYEKITESPAFTWNTLVCNVGGNLGLFLGMSIVTVVELLEFLFDMLLSCCCRRHSRVATEARAAFTAPREPSSQDPEWWQRDGYPPRRAASAAFNKLFLGE